MFNNTSIQFFNNGNAKETIDFFRRIDKRIILIYSEFYK